MHWIGHHNDIAHWALGMDHSGPLAVEAVGWTFPKTDVYNTPQHHEIRCTYPGGLAGTISDRNPLGTKWIGEEGWVFVTRGRPEASDCRWCRSDFHPGPVRVYASPRHTRSFLDCVKSRQPYGAYAVVSQTLAAFEHHQAVKLIGTKGAMWAGWSGAADRTRHPRFFLKAFDGENLEELPITRSAGELFDLEEQIATMVAAVRDGQPAACAGEDRKWSVALCLATQMSVKAGRRVAMNEIL